ncbi:MAG: hypothetical protein KatS3mg111_3689 [Pirellulaceae bacterium]|nr:MAG: hypothetical protein KatS3mg111_3689 [Pirellulaceae bacterium]
MGEHDKVNPPLGAGAARPDNGAGGRTDDRSAVGVVPHDGRKDGGEDDRTAMDIRRAGSRTD